MDKKKIGIWALRGVVAMAFIAAGGAKLAGVQAMVEVFDHVGVGQWFRIVTGVIEVAGGAMVLIPAATAFGAALLACTMVGAVIAHLTVVPGPPVPALVLFALCAALIWLHKDQLTSGKVAEA